MARTLHPWAFMIMTLFGVVASGCAPRTNDFLSDAPYYQNSGRPTQQASVVGQD